MGQMGHLFSGLTYYYPCYWIYSAVYLCTIRNYYLTLNRCICEFDRQFLIVYYSVLK